MWADCTGIILKGKINLVTKFAQFFFSMYVARMFLLAESHRKTSSLVFVRFRCVTNLYHILSVPTNCMRSGL